MRRKALSSPCRYRISAVAIDGKNRIIDISRNAFRDLGISENRSWHAEETIMYRNPPSVRIILIARFNKNGKMLPIEPCCHCANMARKRGIEIVSI